jgi:hypothetical protein
MVCDCVDGGVKMTVSTHVFRCNPFNIDGLHSQMEMLLSSLFDGSFSNEPKSLIASNGSVEYTYTKKGIGNRMTLRVISLEAPEPRFTIKFNGKPFSVCPVKHPLLNLTHLSIEPTRGTEEVIGGLR